MDAYTTALTWLARRELSSAQIRSRLARRHFPQSEIDDALVRLAQYRAVDDQRVARAAAHLEGAIRMRGRRRVLQKVQQLGVSPTIAKDAVDEVFKEIDEPALLDKAIERKLRGADPQSLDAKGTARIVRSLVAQGFEPGAIYARLRTRTGRDLSRAE
jgi:SOS response regulatory protein OraA/RecX